MVVLGLASSGVPPQEAQRGVTPNRVSAVSTSPRRHNRPRPRLGRGGERERQKGRGGAVAAPAARRWGRWLRYASSATRCRSSRTSTAPTPTPSRGVNGNSFVKEPPILCSKQPMMCNGEGLRHPFKCTRTPNHHETNAVPNNGYMPVSARTSSAPQQGTHEVQ